MSSILLLGSKSSSRKLLLTQAQIPFTCVEQDADESICDLNQDWSDIVTSIALQKMEHIVLPDGKKGDACFVLTADTMSVDSSGAIFGKPKDKDDAIRMITSLRHGGIVGTAFCLDRKKYDTTWIVEERSVQFVSSSYTFDMPDEWIEKYFKAVPEYMNASGALFIEGYGSQFLKTINGSYSTILGLPMFEVRQALQKLDFF